MFPVTFPVTGPLKDVAVTTPVAFTVVACSWVMVETPEEFNLPVIPPLAVMFV